MQRPISYQQLSFACVWLQFVPLQRRQLPATISKHQPTRSQQQAANSNKQPATSSQQQPAPASSMQPPAKIKQQTASQPAFHEPQAAARKQASQPARQTANPITIKIHILRAATQPYSHVLSLYPLLLTRRTPHTRTPASLYK